MEIQTLTRSTAERFSKKIIELHNLIPFQKWEELELFGERDTNRIYNLKWEISTICIIENNVIGFCLGFYDKTTITCDIQDFIYIHRIVVHPQYRRLGIGKKLIIELCQKAISLLSTERPNTNFSIIAQTPQSADIQFENTEIFYVSLGFKKIGEKNYPNRIDEILLCDTNTIIGNKTHN